MVANLALSLSGRMSDNALRCDVWEDGLATRRNFDTRRREQDRKLLGLPKECSVPPEYRSVGT